MSGRKKHLCWGYIRTAKAMAEPHKVNSNFSNYAEEHLCMYNTSNLEADGLQWQKKTKQYQYLVPDKVASEWMYRYDFLLLLTTVYTCVLCVS